MRGYMMNRDRMTRGRTMMGDSTILGLPERWERTLVYPLLLVIILFVPSALAWLLGILLGVLLFYIEKNRNVRWNAMQAVATLGPLSILYAVVHILMFLLGGIPLLGGVTVLGLGLLSSVIWSFMIILAFYLTILTLLHSRYLLRFLT